MAAVADCVKRMRTTRLRLVRVIEAAAPGLHPSEAWRLAVRVAREVDELRECVDMVAARLRGETTEPPVAELLRRCAAAGRFRR